MTERTTSSDGDIETEATFGRRSVLRGGVAGAGAALGLGQRPALAQTSGANDASADAAVASRSPTPSDRQGFNRRWYAPDLRKIYAPTNAAEVVAALRSAIHIDGARPGEIQPTCGRHCYENFVYRDQTRIIIDLTGLRSFGDDPAHGLFIDAGYGNWDMFRIFGNVYNRTLPAGSCYSVGLGGHITGGGYGLLSRQFGLTVDHLTAVDIVVVGDDGSNPELITVSETQDRDLFWAVRGGGGGNFGIITRYYFGEPPQAPTRMYTSAFNFDWDNAADGRMTLATFAGLLAAFSTISEHGQGAPDPSFDAFHLNHLGGDSLVWAVYQFDVPGAGRTGPDYDHLVARKFRDRRRALSEIARISNSAGPLHGHPWHGDTRSIMPRRISDAFRSFTYLEGVQNANGSGPNRFGKYKSAYMKRAFSSPMVEALYDGLQRVPDGVELDDMTASLCQVDSYGCAINLIGPCQTAVPQRSSIMKLQYQTYWDNGSAVGADDPVQAQAHLNWIRGLYSDVYAATGGVPDPRRDPDGIVDGCYFNYPDNDLGVNGGSDIERAMYLYFKENYTSGTPALAQVKRAYNPRDWFAGPQSIPLN